MYNLLYTLILLSYELPSAHKILLNPKKNWKPIRHTKIDNFWKNKWSEDAKTKSTLSYMETNTKLSVDLFH
jgi:hypothetical protein